MHWRGNWRLHSNKPMPIICKCTQTERWSSHSTLQVYSNDLLDFLLIYSELKPQYVDQASNVTNMNELPQLLQAILQLKQNVFKTGGQQYQLQRPRKFQVEIKNNYKSQLTRNKNIIFTINHHYICHHSLNTPNCSFYVPLLIIFVASFNKWCLFVDVCEPLRIHAYEEPMNNGKNVQFTKIMSMKLNEKRLITFMTNSAIHGLDTVYLFNYLLLFIIYFLKTFFVSLSIIIFFSAFFSFPNSLHFCPGCFKFRFLWFHFV